MKNIVLSILGSNNFMNYSLFEEKIYKIITFYLNNSYHIIIKEKEQNRVDNFCVRFCRENNFELKRIKIKWDEIGKSAFYVALKEMVYGNFKDIPSSDILIVFFDINSKQKEIDYMDKIINEFCDGVTDSEGAILFQKVYLFIE